MSDDLLPTDLRIAAQIRVAAQAGVPMVVVQKGSPTGGTIYLKINRLDGTAEVLQQIWLDGKRVWISTCPDRLFTEQEADAYLAGQMDFDPDLWIVEVEDRQGRHWFPEPVMDMISSFS